MSWIAEYDTQGREFPTCVHVTKTTGTMTHGATYVPIEDGKAVRAENTKLRELVRDMMVAWWACDNDRCPRHDKRCKEGKFCAFDECARDLGIEVDE